MDGLTRDGRDARRTFNERRWGRGGGAGGCGTDGLELVIIETTN